MRNSSATTTCFLEQYLLAAPLALALTLGSFTARAQVAPTPAPALKPAPKDAVYYLDGQQVSEAETAKLDPQVIASIDVIKGEQQQRAFGRRTAAGAVLITTKANADVPAVRAFNERFPLTAATPEQNAAVAAAQAYLAKTYPTAKVEMVGPDKQRTGYYRAIFEQGGQRMQLLFDANGQPVKE